MRAMLPFLYLERYFIHFFQALLMAKKAKNSQRNKVRIIAGKWRGSTIEVPEAEGLRPTSDRVRETLFNWLQPYIEGSQALDLFAGTGALGVEALSRGAQHLTFVEKQKELAFSIQKNLEKLKANKAEVINESAFEFLKNKKLDAYNLIFLDPPYALCTFNKLAISIEKQLSNESELRIFYENDKAIEESQLPENWYIVKKKKAGQVFFYLLFRKKPD
jgi:16S rRNA (guanine966-N2)-methyltransferase